MEAESAVTARAFFPSAWFAAQARYAESVPPENATMARSSFRRLAKSCSCFCSAETTITPPFYRSGLVQCGLLQWQRLLPGRIDCIGNYRRRGYLIALIERHQP